MPNWGKNNNSKCNGLTYAWNNETSNAVRESSFYLWYDLILELGTYTFGSELIQ